MSAGRVGCGIWLGKCCAVLLDLKSIGMGGRSLAERCGGGVVWQESTGMWWLGVRLWKCCASGGWEMSCSALRMGSMGAALGAGSSVGEI